MPWLLQLSSFWLSSVSPKQTTEGSEQHWSPSYIFPHLASLHWLPIDSRIQYKLSSLCYNCLNLTASDYLTVLLRIYKSTSQPANFTHLLILPFSIFPLYAHTRLVKGLFLMLRRQSGTLSLTRSGHPTPCHPSNHHLKLIFFSSPTDCACVCV